ncbi:MAG TPA: flavin reductase family protein [Pseudomonadales bacterium]|jgi:flavin reductase (DIM6/NTAB) family NADH-FMN oxidoreductase RutF
MTIDSRALRNALGQFATGVTIITAVPKGGKPFGMTVNSFSALSLDPPLVLWSLQKNSECAAAFDQASHYGVNILQHDQMDVSNAFAKKGEHDLPTGGYRLGRSGTPVLKGCMATFECRITDRHDGGDHIILVGEVEEMHSLPDRKPLVFFSGRYRELK